jgi:hypothetical protein
LLGSGEFTSSGGPDYTAGGFPARPSVITPQPPSLFGLPATAGEGDAQPMIGVRAPQQPGLAEDFARTRVVPSRAQLNRMGGTTLPPETQGLALPSGSRLALPSNAGAGEAQPMIGVLNDYPQLATPFARERVPATLFAKPATPVNGLFTARENGIAPQRLQLPAPKRKPKAL